MDTAPVIHPGHTKNDDTFRFHESLQNPSLSILWVSIENRLDGFHDLGDCLMKFFFIRIPRFYNLDNVRHAASYDVDSTLVFV